LPHHLKQKGKAFLLTSSLTPEKKWLELAKTERLKVKKIATEAIFCEELYIWEISPQ